MPMRFEMNMMDGRDVQGINTSDGDLSKDALADALERQGEFTSSIKAATV
jgi:hypothetical protein